MVLTFKQMASLLDTYNTLRDQKLPFKLSLILAKDTPVLEKEVDFYIEQERAFAEKYLERNEDGTYVQNEPNVFKIKEELLEECQAARKDLDEFSADVALHTIPSTLLETFEFTPAELEAMMVVLEEV